MATWERMSIGDLIPLWVEERSTAMNIGLAVLLDPGPLTDETGRIRLAEVRAAVNTRLGRAPALRRRIRWSRFGEGRPVWVDDAGFDVAGHVEAAHLPGADTDRFLSWAATRVACRLDRNRPLWRMVFVSGLVSGEVGVVIVIHHAMADGITGAALAAALLDHGPVQRPPAGIWRPAPAPAPRELRRDAALGRVSAVREAARRIGRRPRSRSDLRDTFTALRSRAPDVDLPSPPAEARTTASVTWRLDEVRAIGHAHTATVNDVMLTAVAAGMQRLLSDRGRFTEGLVLRVSVPTAGASGSRNAGGTTPLVVPLPVDVTDPVRLLAGVGTATRRAKAGRDRSYAGVFAAPLMPAALVRVGLRWMTRHSPSLINLYVTNVPGPDASLWFAGARVRAAYPLPPLIAGVPLAVGVLSYAGALTLTVTSAPGVAVETVADRARTALHTLDGVAREVRR